MPRWRRTEITRIALPADQLESKIIGNAARAEVLREAEGRRLRLRGKLRPGTKLVRPSATEPRLGCLHARIRDGAGAREKGVRLGVGAELARVTVARGVLNQNLERLLRRENPGFFFGFHGGGDHAVRRDRYDQIWHPRLRRMINGGLGLLAFCQSRLTDDEALPGQPRLA
jgi:hypothetical protein